MTEYFIVVRCAKCGFKQQTFSTKIIITGETRCVCCGNIINKRGNFIKAANR